MHRGYVRLWRKTVDSQFWSYGANTIALFSYLLLRANRKEGWFKGVRVMPGQVFISLREVADRLKIGHKAARIALEILREKEVVGAQTGAQHGTLVTFLNWDVYNGDDASTGTAQGTSGAQVGHKPNDSEGTNIHTRGAELGHSLKQQKKKNLKKECAPDGARSLFEVPEETPHNGPPTSPQARIIEAYVAAAREDFPAYAPEILQKHYIAIDRLLKAGLTEERATAYAIQFAKAPPQEWRDNNQTDISWLSAGIKRMQERERNSR